jgi:hypothetical protein
MSGAQPLRIERRVAQPLMGMVATVQEAEGAVQVILARDGWPDGCRSITNDFAGAETPAQLRALADAVEAAVARQEARNAA